MDFGPFLGLIRTINWNLVTFSRTLKGRDPVDPNGPHGPKSALEGSFVLQINNEVIVGQVISLVGLRDPLFALGRAA